MFTADGVMPEDGPETVEKVLKAFNPNIKNAEVDLDKTYTTEFVKKAHWLRKKATKDTAGGEMKAATGPAPRSRSWSRAGRGLSPAPWPRLRDLPLRPCPQARVAQT